MHFVTCHEILYLSHDFTPKICSHYFPANIGHGWAPACPSPSPSRAPCALADHCPHENVYESETKALQIKGVWGFFSSGTNSS